MAKVKVGVIGVGVMGSHHARIYSTLKDALFVGIFDPDPNRSAEVSVRHNCRSFQSLEDLLKEVHAVTLSSPTSTHYQIALSCLEKRIHLLVEKPLAPTLSESQDLVDLSKKKGCVLSVGMIERFNPSFQKAYSIIKHETILGLSFSRFSPYPDRISDASVVMDMMLHDIDLSLLLSASEVDSIRAYGNKVRSPFLDEAVATLYFKNGLIAKLEASRVKPEKKRMAIITTDKAIYEIDLLKKHIFQRLFSHISEKNEIPLVLEDQLTLELKDFMRAIIQSRPPKVSGIDSLLPIKIAQEVEKLSCS